MTTYRRNDITAEPGNSSSFDDEKKLIGIEFKQLQAMASILATLNSIRFKPPLFKLGQMVATPGALDLFDRTGVNANDLLARHVTGDWGDVSDQDATSNNKAIEHGERILSVYKLGPKKETLWLMTEHDRSITTALLPEEY